MLLGSADVARPCNGLGADDEAAMLAGYRSKFRCGPPLLYRWCQRGTLSFGAAPPGTNTGPRRAEVDRDSAHRHVQTETGNTIAL